MLTAVSCLSPVKTQSWIPASRRAAIVSGTPSCSRSSIPVAPAVIRDTGDHIYRVEKQLPNFPGALSSQAVIIKYLPHF